jgi:KaiC/GvpD/RAD55 family RecA-like ATPase
VAEGAHHEVNTATGRGFAHLLRDETFNGNGARTRPRLELEIVRDINGVELRSESARNEVEYDADRAAYDRLWAELEAAKARVEAKPVRVGGPMSLLDVVEQWKTEGPLVHESSGLPKLDELTGGGPVYGSRWYLVGAPDAGKTALLVQIAHEMSARGVAVGYLAVDEEPSDIAMRIAQRLNYLRFECESRSSETLQMLRDSIHGLNMQLYSSEWTVEQCMDDLARKAKADGRPAAFFVDSIQTVTCEAEKVAAKEMSERAAVTARVMALRAKATEHRMVMFATSEMNRAAYRSVDSAEKSNDMAAAAESRAVEYSARVMLALRSVPNEPDACELKLVKNKHGRGGMSLFLRLDRQHQRLTETRKPDEQPTKEENRVRLDAQRTLETIKKHPGIGAMDLRAKTRLGKQSLDVALNILTEREQIENRPETHGKRSFPHYFYINSELHASDAP